jgi:hypothetical protein
MSWRSYGLQPRVRYNVDDRVLVARDPGLEPAEAEIAALSDDRPHVVKIVYVHSRTGAWIAQKRIIGRAEAPETGSRRPKTTAENAKNASTRTTASCAAPIRWSASIARSHGAPTSSASSPTTPPSSGWSGCSRSRPTTNGSSAAPVRRA